MKKECAVCKTGFEAVNPLKKYCSKSCATVVKRQRDQASIGKATCVTCGNEFQPTGRANPKQGKFNKFCSVKCRCDSPEWKAARAKKYLREGRGKKPFCSVSFNTCKVCDSLFTAKSKIVVTCKDECKQVYKEQKRIENNENAKIKSMSLFTCKEFKCRECNKNVIVNYGDMLKSFCSIKCRNKQHSRVNKSVRRARKKDVAYESIDAIKVFNRDKWTCKLCGVKTPKKMRGLMVDNAPELDHIIPLSKGGPHLYINVQCACRKCNGLKSDKIEGQLPLLFNAA